MGKPNSKLIKLFISATSIFVLFILLANGEDIIISPEARAGASSIRKKIVYLPQNDPKKIIQDIYGHYPAVEPDNSWHKVDNRWLEHDSSKPGHANIEDLPNIVDLPLSQEFRKYVDNWNARNPDISCLDVDPIINASDWVFKKYRLNIDTRSYATSRKIYVQLDSDPNLTIIYHFILDNHKWYIDEITDYVFDKEITNIYSTQVKDSHKKGECRAL